MIYCIILKYQFSVFRLKYSTYLMMMNTREYIQFEFKEKVIFLYTKKINKKKNSKYTPTADGTLLYVIRLLFLQFKTN